MPHDTAALAAKLAEQRQNLAYERAHITADISACQQEIDKAQADLAEVHTAALLAPPDGDAQGGLHERKRQDINDRLATAIKRLRELKDVPAQLDVKERALAAAEKAVQRRLSLELAAERRERITTLTDEIEGVGRDLVLHIMGLTPYLERLTALANEQQAVALSIVTSELPEGDMHKELHSGLTLNAFGLEPVRTAAVLAFIHNKLSQVGPYLEPFVIVAKQIGVEGAPEEVLRDQMRYQRTVIAQRLQSVEQRREKAWAAANA